MRKLTALIALVLMLPGVASAYVGPGLGLGAIAVIVGVVLSVLIALIAIVWYPIKRRMKARREREAEEARP
jgi:hypothetical protein